MERPQIFSDPVVTHLGPLAVTKTAIVSLIVSAVLWGIVSMLGWAALRRPSSVLGVIARWAYRGIDSLVTETAGTHAPLLTVFSGSLFLFIGACVIAGQLPGVRAPTANLATDAALAILVFLAVPLAGIRVRGARAYLREYFRPNVLFFPLHVISEVSRTLALALRLFGNMLSGQLVVVLLVALVGLLVPTPLMALDLLIGILQAYIFTVLSTVYVGAAIRREEG